MLLMLSIGLTVLFIFLISLLLWLLWDKKNSQKFQQELILNQMKENKDLLNRLMSGDLQTYMTMKMADQTLSGTFNNDEYISASDEAEAARLQGLAQGSGFGEPIYGEDTEFEQTMGELGLFAKVDDE